MKGVETLKITNGVRACLYAGICNKIDTVTTLLPGLDQLAIDVYLRDITEALAFYKVECVLSSTLLETRYAELAASIRDWKEVNTNGQTQRTQVDRPAGTA